MTIEDHRGLPASGANERALALYETAVGQYQCYTGDPVAAVDAAIAEAPDFAMAHALRAYLFITGTDARGTAEIAASRAALERAPRCQRGHFHLAAIDAFMAGEWATALERLEDILIAWPHDVVALQTAHLFDFYTGDARNLRDRVARRLPFWTRADPGYHALLAMHAFGLEECGAYAAAEARGREAIEMEPRDAWAQHAVAHVMEMQGRVEDGVRWMETRTHHWAPDNFFAVHNWWHLALYHLELGETAKALELYDGPIQGGRSGLMLDMVDASALLWRLTLAGIDTGERWHAVAATWQPVAEDGFYAFNDVHAVIAQVGAGRLAEARQTMTAMERAVERGRGVNVAMTAEVGLPVARALIAFGEGAYGETVRLLRPLRSRAHRFGGSHAQRDILDLTLIEAAFRAGQNRLVRALAGERTALKPTSPVARRYMVRAEAAGGGNVKAAA